MQAGRQPDDVKIFMGTAVVTGETQAIAREKYADYLSYASREAGLAHFAASTGVDFARHGLDEPVDYGNGNAIESATRAAAQRGWTRRQLLELFELGGRYPAIVGDPRQVADELQSWISETGIDGFNLSRTVVPESYDDFVDLVVPELQNRGRLQDGLRRGNAAREVIRRWAPTAGPACRGRVRRPA